MLTRNLKARVAKAAFYDDYNDIDIFIEDTAKGYKKLFSKILQRVLGNKYKVDSVFPLGGRGEVLTACKADQTPKNRARIYIIDGDLYLLSGEIENTKINGLFVLPRYCIENHLICDLSFISILDEEEADKSYDEIEQLFNFSGWIDAIKTHLIDLFIEYGIGKKIAPSVQSVAFGYSGLVSSNTGELDEKKVNNRIKSMRQEIINIAGIELYNITRKEVSNLVQYDKQSLLTFISGKDILMPLLFMRCKRLVDFKVTNIAFKQRLANICDLESMSELPNYIYKD
jgi:hypothetical protein